MPKPRPWRTRASSWSMSSAPRPATMTRPRKCPLCCFEDLGRKPRLIPLIVRGNLLGGLAARGQGEGRRSLRRDVRPDLLHSLLADPPDPSQVIDRGIGPVFDDPPGDHPINSRQGLQLLLGRRIHIEPPFARPGPGTVLG